MNKKLRISLIVVLIILIAILSAIEIKQVLNLNPDNQVKVEPTHKVGPYTLEVAQTSILQEDEKNLKTAIEQGKEKPLVQAVAKYFVSDYFTLRYKNNMNDVGGLGVVFPKTKNQFKINAIDSYYLDVAEFNADYGPENLPLVDEISVNNPVKIDKSTVDFDTKAIADDVKAVYDVTAKWQYEANEKVNATKLGIVNQIVVRLVVDKENQVWVYELLGVN